MHISLEMRYNSFVKSHQAQHEKATHYPNLTFECSPRCRPTSTVLIDFSTYNTQADKNNYNAETGWNKVEGNETPNNFSYPKVDATASELKTTTGEDSTITATFKAVSNDGFLSNSKGSYGEEDFNKMGEDELDTTNIMWQLMHGASVSVTEALETAWKEQVTLGSVIYGDLVVNGLTASTQSIITEGTTTTTTITNRTYAVSLTFTATGSNFANHVAEGGVSLSGDGITVKDEHSYITSHDGTLRFDDGGLNTEALKDTTFMTITWVFDAPVSEEEGDLFGFTIHFDSARDWGGALLIGALGISQFDNITVDQVTDQFEEDLGNTGGWNPGGENIPEPTTATLSLLALAGLAARRRRK